MVDTRASSNDRSRSVQPFQYITASNAVNETPTSDSASEKVNSSVDALLQSVTTESHVKPLIAVVRVSKVSRKKIAPPPRLPESDLQ